MKKIDKNSKLTQNLCFGMELVSGIGAEVAIESALIPFVAMIWKRKPIRLAGYIGSAVLALGGGAFAIRTVDDVLDVFVDIYNSVADVVNGESSEQSDPTNFDIVEEIPADYITTGKISRKDIDGDWTENPLVDAVANSKIFEFKREEDAKTLIESIDTTHGPATILDFAKAKNWFEPSWGKEYFDKIDIPEAKIYGWKSFDGVEIEQVNDDLFFVDLLNYEILPEKVNYYKDSDMNHMVPKED